MTWQDVGVALTVGAAVAFLLVRVTGRRRRRKPAQTFVPLSSLKTRPDAPDKDERGCH